MKSLKLFLTGTLNFVKIDENTFFFKLYRTCKESPNVPLSVVPGGKLEYWCGFLIEFDNDLKIISFKFPILKEWSEVVLKISDNIKDLIYALFKIVIELFSLNEIF